MCVGVQQRLSHSGPPSGTFSVDTFGNLGLHRPMQNLIGYVLAAMLAWFPLSKHPEPEVKSAARYAEVARAIAEVALDPGEPPLFDGPAGRARTALVDAGIAALEGGFRAYVDDGSCNAVAFLAGRRPHCDHGRAYSIWQIQTARGMSLHGDTWQWWSLRSPEARITGPDLIADRKLAARLALHIARKSIRDYGSLCAYTGEKCRGAHPNADARLALADRWWRSHPFRDDVSLLDVVGDGLETAAVGTP
jgi:hypothetical protein